MSEDRYIELAPLAALGALDGAERAGFEAHAASCPACRGELSAHEAVAARIPLALAQVATSEPLRLRVLDSARGLDAARPRASASPVRPAGWLISGLAAAAVLVLAFGLFTVRSQRDAALREAEQARHAVAALTHQVRKAEDDVGSLRRSLEDARAFRALVADPDSRVAPLAGLKDAPQARARVVWNPLSREAVLMATGLPRAPEGKAYEVWVIAQAAPVAAGVFQVDADGKATFRLPIVEDTARVKTFAVTLETAPGVPAPTGPMVLAGTVS